jgi:uncharacterized membrane protein YecN with MAPEG domain
MPEIDIRALSPLILFAMWAVLLMLRLGVARVSVMRREKRDVDTFKPLGDTEDLDTYSRAHMNALENLPIFAVVYLSALWVDAAAPVAILGWIVLAARVLQSLVHINARGVGPVRVRALMQLTQAVCFLWLGGAALYWANAG